jgi:glycosyltransferase involved in cell wall biosynthesis
MAEKTKILHLITNLPVGGAQDNTLITVERLDRSKFDVTLMCAPEGQWVQRARQLADVNLIFVEELRREIHVFYDVAAFFRIYRSIRHGRYAIVHTHSSKPGFLGRLAARLAGVPVIIHTIHGFPFHDFMPASARNFYIWIERQLARMTDYLVTVSRLNLEKAVQLRLAKRDKLVNVYSGIDFEKFDVEIDVRQKRRELGLGEGENVVGMVGRLSEQKAPWNLIQAIPQVLRHHPRTRFVFVGDGELKHKMQELAKDLNVSAHTLFLGFRDDVAEVMQTLEVYVLPSQWEGLGRSLTEAMYLERAVVATAVEGVPELVENGKTGILVPPNQPQALAHAITSLLSDPEKCRQLGEAARRKVEGSFEAKHMLRDLERLYNIALKEKKTSAHWSRPQKPDSIFQENQSRQKIAHEQHSAVSRNL